MKLLAIANPTAGRGRCGRLLPEIRALLSASGHDVEFSVSTSREHLIELASSGVRRGVDAIVSCGGDGTAHYILQAVLGSPVALGLVSVGTGNDWAANLGFPADHRAACATFRRGQTKSFDVAKAGDQFYLSVAGTGFDAEVNRLANRGRTWLRGRAVYVCAVVRALARFRPRPVEIEFDGRHFAGRVMLVAVGNGFSYGGGVKVVPQARLDDGWLDLCIVKQTSRLDLVRNLPRLYEGGHVDHPAIDMHRVRRVTISSPEHMDLYGDGEYLQDLPVTIEVVPQALRVIVPAAR